MKKLLVVLTLVAFAFCVPMAMAQDKPAAAKVKCCADKKCSEVADKAACDKIKGKVVKDCAECK